MALIYRNFRISLGNAGPILLLYFLSITEIDTEFSKTFDILSFNLQLIVIYYWALKNPDILGNSHIFFAGIINDLIMALPMGTSAMSYLIVAFVASYIRNVTVNNSLMTDWFTFLIAIFFSNLTYLILISNFSDYGLSYINLFYNSFFTFIFYPLFWLIFNIYKALIMVKIND